MGQSERSELVTNRLRGDPDGLRREDLNSGGDHSTAEKRRKPLSNYLEVIADESEEN